MGVSGTGIIDDDEAKDIRALYKDIKKFGISGTEAVSILARNFAIDESRPVDRPLFFLVVASLLWKDGRLPENLKDTALALINSGADLGRWQQNAALIKKRKSVLEELAAQLRSPQPDPAKLPIRNIEQSSWEIGEIIAFHHNSGNIAILRVVSHYTKFGGKSPIIEVLDWNKSTIPPESVIKKLDLMPRRCPLIHSFTDTEWNLFKQKNASNLPSDYTREEYKNWELYPLFALIRLSETDKYYKKAQRLNIISQPTRRFFQWMLPLNGWHLWKNFDQSSLHSYFHDSFPSHLDYINRTSKEYEERWKKNHAS